MGQVVPVQRLSPFGLSRDLVSESKQSLFLAVWRRAQFSSSANASTEWGLLVSSPQQVSHVVPQHTCHTSTS